MFTKKFMLSVAMVVLAATGAVAQKQQKETVVWEESTARQIVPQVRTFVAPTICDMQMLSNSREFYGPYAIDVRRYFSKVGKT